MSNDTLTFRYDEDGYKADFILADPKMTSIRLVLSQNWKSLAPPVLLKRLLELNAAMLEWHKHMHRDVTYVYFAGIQYDITYCE